MSWGALDQEEICHNVLIAIVEGLYNHSEYFTILEIARILDYFSESITVDVVTVKVWWRVYGEAATDYWSIISYGVQRGVCREIRALRFK